MNKKVLFSHFDRQGKRVEYQAEQGFEETLKIFLLEGSFTEDLGDIYKFVDNEWKKLDYYNS